MNQVSRLRQIFDPAKALSLLVLGLCEFVRGALLFFILPIYVRSVLGFSTALVGYAVAAHYAVDTSLRGPAGWMTDRFGQRRVLLAALAVSWVGLWTVLHARSSPWLVAGCALLGTGMATVWPAVIARVTHHLPTAAYATAMSGVMMAWLAGVGGGAVSMGWLFGYHVHRGFLLLLMVWLLATCLTWWAMPRREAWVASGKRLHWRYVWSDLRSVWLLLPGMFVQTFAMGVLMPVLVLYTHDVLGFSGALYSALLVTSGGATVCLQLPIGRWVDRLGYRPFLVGGFAVCAVLLPTFLQLRDAAYVFLGAAGLGLGYAMILPAWSAVLAQAVSEARKAVMWGIFMTVEGLGMAAGPLVSSRLWTSLGSSAPFWATSVILFAMMLFYGFAPLERWSARTAEDGALEELREVL